MSSKNKKPKTSDSKKSGQSNKATKDIDISGLQTKLDIARMDLTPDAQTSSSSSSNTTPNTSKTAEIPKVTGSNADKIENKDTKKTDGMEDADESQDKGASKPVGADAVKAGDENKNVTLESPIRKEWLMDVLPGKSSAEIDECLKKLQAQDVKTINDIIDASERTWNKVDLPGRIEDKLKNAAGKLKGGGKMPDLNSLRVECRTRRSLGRERIGRSQWCIDNRCECGSDAPTTLDTYFSFENREDQVQQLQSDTNDLWKWWGNAGLRDNPKKHGHHFLVLAGASGTGKSTFIRKAFSKMLNTPLGGSESYFDSVVAGCVESGNLFRINFDRIDVTKGEPIALLLLAEALKYSKAFPDLAAVKQEIERMGGDWRQLTLRMVFDRLFGPPPRKTNMVVVQLDELNHVQDMKYVEKFVKDLFDYQCLLPGSSPTFLVSCFSGTDAKSIQSLFPPKSPYRFTEMFLPPLNLDHFHNIICSVLKHSRSEDAEEFCAMLDRKDLCVRLLDVLLVELGGNPLLFSFAIELLFPSSPSVPPSPSQPRKKGTQSKYLTRTFEPSSLSALLGGISQLNVQTLVSQRERLVEVVRDQRLGESFDRLFDDGMQAVADEAIRALLTDSLVARETKTRPDSWSFGDLEANGCVVLVRESARPDSMVPTPETKTNCFRVRIPLIILHRIQFRLRDSDLPLLPSLNLSLELSPKANERQDVAYILFRLWSLWKTSTPEQRKALSLDGVIDGLPPVQFKLLDGDFKSIHSMPKKYRPRAKGSKDPDPKGFEQDMRKLLDRGHAVACVAMDQDSFADAWIVLLLPSGSLFFVFIQSKRSVNLAKVTADVMQREYDKVKWVQNQFVLLLISDGEPDAVPKELQGRVVVKCAYQHNFFGATLALRRALNTQVELSGKESSSAQRASMEIEGTISTINLALSSGKSKSNESKDSASATTENMMDSDVEDFVCECRRNCGCKACRCLKHNRCGVCTAPCHKKF